MQTRRANEFARQRAKGDPSVRAKHSAPSTLFAQMQLAQQISRRIIGRPAASGAAGGSGEQQPVGMCAASGFVRTNRRLVALPLSFYLVMKKNNSFMHAQEKGEGGGGGGGLASGAGAQL